MSKSLTDQELRTQFRTLSHGQLEDYLIQVARQLGQYRAGKTTKKGRFFWQKLIKKGKFLLSSGLFKLDLQFFNGREEELEKLLKEAEEERTLAAEIGQTLLEENKKLKNELKVLTGQLRKKVNAKEVDRLNSIITDYEKEKENWENRQRNVREKISKDKAEIKKVQSQNILLEQQIGVAGTENEHLKNQLKNLQKKNAEQQKEISDNNEVLKNDGERISGLINSLAKEKELRKKDNQG
jgi:hypothetical protein